jgi:hypothetical protein
MTLPCKSGKSAFDHSVASPSDARAANEARETTIGRAFVVTTVVVDARSAEARARRRANIISVSSGVD